MGYLKWSTPKNHFIGPIKCFINIGEAFRCTYLYLFQAFQKHLSTFSNFRHIKSNILSSKRFQLNNCNLSPDCRHGNAHAITL